MPPNPAVTPHSPRLAPVILENNWRLPRRSFLKGAGAMLGLPLLEAMGKVSAVAAPDAVASTQTAASVQAPVRMACIYFPNGVLERNWFPKTAGPDFELLFALEPLSQASEQFAGVLGARQTTQSSR